MSRHLRLPLILWSLAVGTNVLGAFAIAQNSAQTDKPSAIQPPSGTVTQQDKLTACRNLAQRKNLSGKDEKTFIKDCMQKANSK
jgi:hypothetical protein